MAIAINNKNHYRTINRTCLAANIIYLILHIFYLILFAIAHLDILLYIDLTMVLFFLSSFLIIKKKKYYLYALLCGNAFFAFISTTTIMLGFSTGFHLYLIGLCVVSFFSTYFSRNKEVKNSIIWAILSLIIYLALYIITRYVSPYYAIDRWLEMTLFITHSIIAFSLVAAYLVIFLRYAISLENKITNESRTDELTQIANRYALYDYFDDIRDKSSLILALFDIDNFKNINDTYGHVEGDFVLKEIARITNSTLEGSFICRYGGEEFIAVLKDDDAYNKLDALRSNIEKEDFIINDKNIKLTITIGAAKYRDDLDLEKWIELADEKMYQGKNSGKNKIIF